MTYTDRMTQIRTQRAYTRTIARDGLSALLAPYTAHPAVAIPAQRRRFVRERISA